MIWLRTGITSELVLFVEIWGSKGTGRFIKLSNGDKIAYEYARLINASR